MSRIDEIARKHVTCACYSPEHTLLLEWDEKEQEIFISVFLNQYRNIFERIWVAIKYIFGYKCRNGDWDCFIGDKKRIKELRYFFNYVVREDYKKV